MNENKFREYFKLCVGISNELTKVVDLFDQYCDSYDKYGYTEFTNEQEELFKPYVDNIEECLEHLIEKCGI